MNVGTIEIIGDSVDHAEIAAFFRQQLRHHTQLALAAPAAPRRRRRSSKKHLTSIVILTHNQRFYTEMCLASIRLRTPEPYELIVVDNGSTDGTVAWLQEQSDVRLIANNQNRGFAAGCNQGIREARGDQVLLLNNDVMVTEGWLARLLSALRNSPDVGLVGPLSNCVSGAQCVPCDYRNLDGLDTFAAQRAAEHASETDEADRLVGFCLLVRRAVFDKIGLFDEQFGLGNFEDDDFCRRASSGGFRMLMARDAFVHHFGSVSFLAMGLEAAKAIYFRNLELFQNKWHQAPLSIPSPTSNVAVAEPVRRTKQKRERKARRSSRNCTKSPILSLSMIVRDNERTIKACLESIRPWVDEMVVVDTGSVDRTPEIARDLGAKVFHFPWCDDFSAARNESIRHAQGEWIFWMDSDDTIDETSGRNLQALAHQPHDPKVLGYVMQVHCPGGSDEGDNDVTVVDHVKLFRNLPHLRFEGRIHEQILPAIRAAEGEVGWTDFHVTHSGCDHSPAAQQRKRERDQRLLHLELAERPEHPFTLFNLGMTACDGQRHTEAVDYLERCLHRSEASASYLPKAYALLTYSLRQTGRTDEAWRVCHRGMELFPHDAELHFRLGNLHHEAGQLDEAIGVFQRVLELPTGERRFRSVDSGIQGAKAHFNIATICDKAGDHARAEAEWREVLQMAPRYRPAWQGLIDVLLHQGRAEEAWQSATSLLDQDGLTGLGRVLRAQVAQTRRDLPMARGELERAVAEFPEDLPVRRAWCRFVFEHGELQEATEEFLELLRRDPSDASAHHNLGTIYVRRGEFRAAQEAYKQSLVLRPDSASTHLYLGYAYRESGDSVKTLEAFAKAAQLAPEHPEVLQALAQLQPRAAG